MRTVGAARSILTRHAGTAATGSAGTSSPYAARFSNGATLYPRLLLLVEDAHTTAAIGTCPTRSARAAVIKRMSRLRGGPTQGRVVPLQHSLTSGGPGHGRRVKGAGGVECLAEAAAGPEIGSLVGCSLATAKIRVHRVGRSDISERSTRFRSAVSTAAGFRRAGRLGVAGGVAGRGRRLGQDRGEHRGVDVAAVSCTSVARFAVVICGGGIAGVEGLLRLRKLVGDQVEITLLSPSEYLTYRPLAVLEPFATGRAPRYSLPRIAADAGAHLVRDTLDWVDRDRRTVHTGSGKELAYDALLLAVGGRERPPLKHTHVFTGSDDDTLRGIIEEVETGAVTSLAFALPAGPCWPLPLYELALLTTHRAKEKEAHPQIAFTIPGPRPLHAFGGGAGNAVTRLLRDAGITVHTSASVHVAGPQHLVLRPSGVHLRPERTVTLPTISGPDVRGIPGDATHRFLCVDGYCRVRGTDGHIFAAGDATDLPVKQGGVGAQQADTSAAGIAHLAGLAKRPEILHPVIRGSLYTAGKPLYLSAHLIGGEGWQAELYDQAPWPSDDKVIAEELGPYLRAIQAAPQHPPNG